MKSTGKPTYIVPLKGHVIILLITLKSFLLNAQTVDTYSTVGTFTWVVPACVTSVTVRVWGGGGGGAGASSNDLNGGGGGGGAFCMKTETVTPGETLRITVGAGGTVSTGNGGAGGFSQVEHLTGPVVFCKAAGGSGGVKASCSTCSGAGGSGGLISANIPVNTGFSGGTGGSSDPATASVDRGGGGGGSAGTGSSGGNGGYVTAGLAGSPGGGSGGTGASTTTAMNGSPGVFPGGGGGGGATWNSSATGGAGAKGQVTITYVATGCEPAQTTFSYTTPGSYSWVVPACVNYVSVEAWGGGGGGGGNIAILTVSGGETCTGAGGGGGGGYAARTYAVTPGQTYTIVVGNGGTAGAAGAGTTAGITTAAGTGGTGQSSTFSGPATSGPGTLTGVGGTGGQGAGGRNTSSTACLAVSAAAGSGGTGLNGTLNYTGGNGAAGYILDHSTDKSGGGGGAAGPGGNGGTATPGSSVGIVTPPAGVGNSPGGNGGTGDIWNVPSLHVQNGFAGNAIGGGGGGSLIHTSNGGFVYTATGGVGGRGEVRLTYNTGCPLPIELIYFTGSCQDRVKTFKWSTATEHNNHFFTIEQSKDGNEFQPVKVIEGAGNSTAQLNYSTSLDFEDEAYTYFRLKQTDYDGASTYSGIQFVGCTNVENDADLSLFPNPTSGILNLEFKASFVGQYSLNVVDLLGRNVYSENISLIGDGAHVIDTKLYENGIYTIQLTERNSSVILTSVQFTKIN